MDHADIFLTDLEAQLLIEVAFSGLYFCANCDDHFIRVFVCVCECVRVFVPGRHNVSFGLAQALQYLCGWQAVPASPQVRDVFLFLIILISGMDAEHFVFCCELILHV